LDKAIHLLEENNPSNNNLGLRNVHDRLRLLYGPEAGLKIALRPGGGTIVEFSLPKVSQGALKEVAAG
jgi:sensor histidine kinase YesM